MCSVISGRAPIFQRLCQLQSDVLAFHTPGHKLGQRGSELLADWLPDATAFDLTEIADLDSIHDPDGPLLEAERLAAELYAVKNTYFTTNGSTAGVIGSLLCATAPGAELLLPRNAHLSVLSAIILGDFLPRFVQPTWQNGHLLGVTPPQLTEALERHRAVKTVLLVSPSYQGAVGNLASLVRLAKAAGCLVVVDEAHGAHLPFHPALPPSAISTGADLVVQSAHKTLSALTGGAWVHRLTDSLPYERVRSCLNLVQSTSPSWLILGSLDLARLELAESGQAKLTAVLRNVKHLRQLISGAGCSLWDAPAECGFYQDPLKLNLESLPIGYSGDELAMELERSGIHVELAQANGVLLLLGLGDIEQRYLALDHCLRSLQIRQPLASLVSQPPPLPRLALRPREAHFAESHLVELPRAMGRVAARPLSVYPPGIPLVYPGELIDMDVVACAQAALDRGGRVVGGQGDRVMVVA